MMALVLCQGAEVVPVAKRISELEPRAIFTHCYGHALNLVACDTLKKSKLMKNALELTHEITKLIKYSPRREGIFQKLKGLSIGNLLGQLILKHADNLRYNIRIYLHQKANRSLK